MIYVVFALGVQRKRSLIQIIVLYLPLVVLHLVPGKTASNQFPVFSAK